MQNIDLLLINQGNEYKSVSINMTFTATLKLEGIKYWEINWGGNIPKYY